MIYSFDDLVIQYKNYANVKTKVSREIKARRLIPLVRGLYETDPNISGKYLAGRILGPSYLSFDYALAIYSLIPEAVYNTYTSASFNKRKQKNFENYFGTFTYRDIPSEAYPFDILLYEEKKYSYQIATPEKAICDKLYTLPPVKNLTEFSTLLFDDLRIDETEFKKLNKNTIEELAPLYRSNNLRFLAKFIRRIK